MSSPSDLISQTDLTSGELCIPADGKYLSYAAICEALRCELPDKVWQIIRRKTTPEGVMVSYKAMPTYQWELLQAKLDPKDWPMVPQDQKHRRDIHRRRQIELVVMSLTSALFVILLTLGTMAYRSNADYEQGLEAILQGRSHSRAMANAPQKRWVSSLNELTRLLASEGYSVVGFEVNAKGGSMQLMQPQNAATDAMDIFEAAWPDVAFKEKNGGYQWSW